MKTFKILAILIVVVGIIYYQLDKQLFYYGRHDLHIYHLLPFNVQPDYYPPFEGGFALRNQDGLSIASQSDAYPVNNKMISIYKVLKYGFNKQDLVAIVVDSKKTKYYLKFYWDPNISTVNATMDIYNRPINSNLYKWIDIDDNEDYIRKIFLFRNYSMFIVIIFLLIFLYKLVSLIKANKRNTKTTYDA